MKTVFVFGDRDSEKNEILSIVLKNYRNIAVIDFEDIFVKTLASLGKNEINLQTALRDIDNAKKFKTLFVKILKEEIKTLPKNKNIIVSGYFTIHTAYGDVILLSEDFFKKHAPDAVIWMESENEKKTPPSREYAVVFSVISGSVLKIIKIKPGNYREAIRELEKTFRLLFGC